MGDGEGWGYHFLSTYFPSDLKCEQNLSKSLLGGLPSTFTYKLSWHLQLEHTNEVG